MKTSHLALCAALVVGLAACASNKSPTIQYACDNGGPLSTQVLNSDRIAVTFGGKVVPMKREVAASGVRYVGEGWQWWTKGDQGTLTVLEPGKSYAEPKGTVCRDVTAD